MTRRELARMMVLGLVSTTALSMPLGLGLSSGAVAAPQPSGLAVQAAKLALKGDFEGAGSAAERSRDEAAVKLVELIFLRDRPNDAGYGRIMDFLNVAPKWPLTDSLMKRAERALYNNNDGAEVVLRHFANRTPMTDEGKLALARATLARGDRAGADALVQQVWSDPDMDADLERKVASEFGSLIGTEDNKRRMWGLVFAQEGNAAVRMSKRLDSGYQSAAKVAQQLLARSGGADKAYAKLPSPMREQTAMKYALVYFYRKQEKYSAARSVLLTIPADAGDRDALWVERRIVARHSIGVTHRDSAKAAYQIARANGFKSGDGAIEGEFLAGWIALRYVKDANTALGHFNKLESAATSRTEKARAKYWQGRALEAMGNKGDAKSAYREASQYSTIYYGQLAREKIGLGRVPEEISSGTPSPAAVAKIDGDEVVRAFRIMDQAGDQKDLYMFLSAFAQRFNSVDDMNAAAQAAFNIGGPTMAVRLAKAAGIRNIDIDAWSYPIRALPDWKQIGKPVEKALVFGLARQESEFNPTAGSSVGAQGLMQIMPGTAKLIAKQYGLPYRNGLLTGDPAYNVKLGAAHLGDLVDDFGGSYVLTFVAYNAGPRRAKEWLAEYGDLRSGEVDPIDWVESIPFQETRQYVQKVMQNIHVYRSRLAPNTVRPMTADLARGSANAVAVSDQPGTTKEADCSGGSITDIIAACN